jgi:hypothetical protein
MREKTFSVSSAFTSAISLVGRGELKHGTRFSRFRVLISVACLSQKLPKLDYSDPSLAKGSDKISEFVEVGAYFIETLKNCVLRIIIINS